MKHHLSRARAARRHAPLVLPFRLPAAGTTDGAPRKPETSPHAAAGAPPDLPPVILQFGNCSPPPDSPTPPRRPAA